MMAMKREHELHGRRKGRNYGVLLVLLAFIGLIFAVTIVKLGGNVKNPTADVESWGTTLFNWIFG